MLLIIVFKTNKTKVNQFHSCQTSPKWETRRGYNFKHNNDFLNTLTPYISMCGDACISYRECTHFTFTNEDRLCQMKTGKVELIKEKYANMVCGIIKNFARETIKVSFESNKITSMNKFGKKTIKLGVYTM